MLRGGRRLALFDIIPRNFFSVLASPNKEIYIDALMLLHRMFQYEINVELDDYISGLISTIEDREFFIEENEEEQGSLSTNQKARLILQKLISTGWLDREFKDGSFIEVLTLRDYSIKVLKLLDTISNAKTQEYNSLVFSSYSSLKQAKESEPQRMYDALLAAKESTSRLIDELKSLYHNIRTYHRQISEVNGINELLRDHFEEYKSLIDRIYHPIKTMDSIYRYSRPIQEILIDVLGNQELLDSMCKRAKTVRLYENEEKALEAIRGDIDFVMVAYQSVGGLVDEIDRKHNTYTRNSIEKMRYLLTADRSLKGKLVQILKSFSNCEEVEQEMLFELLQRNLVVNRQEGLDAKSFYHKNVRSRRVEAEPLQVQEEDERASVQALDGMLSQIKNSFPTARIRTFMLDLLQNDTKVQTKDIEIEDDTEFILLLLATIRASDRNMPYLAELQEGMVENNGYRIPDITFIRKEKL